MALRRQRKANPASCEAVVFPISAVTCGTCRKTWTCSQTRLFGWHGSQLRPPDVCCSVTIRPPRTAHDEAQSPGYLPGLAGDAKRRLARDVAPGRGDESLPFSRHESVASTLGHQLDNLMVPSLRRQVDYLAAI
jgi:type IV secretory pathway protease TraF